MVEQLLRVREVIEHAAGEELDPQRPMEPQATATEVPVGDMSPIADRLPDRTRDMRRDKGRRCRNDNGLVRPQGLEP
jgi:hypothetical protein